MKTPNEPMIDGENDEFATGNSIGFLVRKTDRSYLRVLERRLRPHKITTSMWFFLRLLWEGDGLTQKECSKLLGLTQPTTVSGMDTLERRGLIKRVRNTEDRRTVNIFLTDAGRQLCREISHYAAEVNRIGLADLDTEEVEVFRSLLNRVNAALERDG